MGRKVAGGAVLAGIIILATCLRVYRINEKSFWTDEIITAQLACGRGQVELPMNVIIESPLNPFDLRTAEPIHKVWFAKGAVNIPPMYVFLTRIWGECFGLGELSLRGFATAASVGAIVAMFFAMRELSGTAAALWAAALMALAGPQIQYAQEARHYSLLLLEGLSAATALARIERRGVTVTRCMVLGASVLAMALTHYFSIGALIALALYAAVRLRGRPLKMVAMSFAAAGVAWLALGLPVALEQMSSVNDPRFTQFLRDPSPTPLGRHVLRFALIPVLFFTEPMGNVKVPAAVGAVAFVLIAALAWRRREMLLWALWLWLTVLPVAMLDVFRGTMHMEFVRYVLLASPALYALVAAALTKGRIRHLPPLLAAVACVLALPAAYSAWWKADWRRFASEIDAAAGPGELIVYWQGDAYPAYPNDAYVNTTYYRPPRGPIMLLSQPMAIERAALVVSPVGAAPPPDTRLTRVTLEPGAGVLWRNARSARSAP